MPILLVILAAIVGAVVWYFRMRGPDAVGDVVNAAGHVKGAYNRRKFRQKVEGATLTGIDDPGLAAGVLMVSLAEAGSGLSEEHETAISVWLRDVVEYRDPVEALVFAKWAAREVVDVNEVIRRLVPLWREKLDPNQRRELIAAAGRIATINGGPDDAQVAALRRLTDGLSG